MSSWTAHAAAWITAALALGAVLFARRYGGGAALEEMERANRILTHRVDELTADNRRLGDELTALKAKTDVTLALVPVIKALEMHEERAAERSTKTLTVLDLIAGRLGPDAEAA